MYVPIHSPNSHSALIECQTGAGTKFSSTPARPQDVYRDPRHPHRCPDGWRTLDRSTDNITVYRRAVHNFIVAGKMETVSFQVCEVTADQTRRGTWTIAEAVYMDRAGIVHNFDHSGCYYCRDRHYNDRRERELMAVYRAVWLWLEDNLDYTPEDNFAHLPETIKQIAAFQVVN